MALVLNGSNNTIGGLAVGGVPDNTIDNGCLADDAVGIADLSATGTASATTFLRGDNAWVGAGITEADQYRLAVSLQGDADPITSNWERNDTSGFGKLGTGLTQSSGVWTFPSTGIWHIHSIGKIKNDDMNKWGEFMLYTTINNGSSWEKQSEPGGAVPDFGVSAYNDTVSDFLFDVTSTTDCKVRFAINQNDTGAYLVGHTSYNTTSVTFIRLGDT